MKRLIPDVAWHDTYHGITRHHNTGDCCSTSCEWASAGNTPYNCHVAELDPYFCNDPDYAIDIVAALQSQTSAATTMLQSSSFMWHRQETKRNDLGFGGCVVEVLASLMMTTMMVIAGINAATML